MAIAGRLGGRRHRILFVDAFDSFTNNIVGLLEESCADTTVELVHINDAGFQKNLESRIEQFDAVVVGPGPGHPSNPDDVGFINQLWQLSEERMLPILGICLGFQSLCFAHGATVEKLARARHGIVNRVTHQDDDIFSGIGDLEATQYHSLRANLGFAAGDDYVSWTPSETCPDLQPLAWDVDDELNGPIVMGVRHTTKPFWGVQFHPESICTNKAGKALIQSWWDLARDWSRRNGREVAPPLQEKQTNGTAHKVGGQGNGTSNGDALPVEQGQGPLAEYLLSITDGQVSFEQSVSKTIGELHLPHVLEALGLAQDQVLVLDSQGHPSGRYSIIGLVMPDKTAQVSYRVADKTLRYATSSTKQQSIQLEGIEGVWPALQDALDLFQPPTPFVFEKNIPFWGGFMGLVSYEAGLESIDVAAHPSCKESTLPDVSFAFIHRSIVIDHHASNLVIQSLLPDDEKWLATTSRIIDNLSPANGPDEGTHGRDAKRRRTSDAINTGVSPEDRSLNSALARAKVTRPAEREYRDKVLRCQDFLASGDSYELCLTDETTIEIPGEIDEWDLYKRLRRNNPAPHGAFLRLGDMTVIGSSPERFLRWTREGQCQFRPIKGTVKKGPGMTRERAHEILDSSKERAENLMIVDLIRHDLSGVIGADKTWVSKLMVVEEYETVYQLVSVIEGELPDKRAGLEVLKSSLPPGSMTGAPKKRSCEILRDIEKRPRSLYSGVIGYMDIGGAGDFSVVIRTAFRGSKDSTWRVGAGGAVTIQSTDEAEFHEMETKQSSVLASLFQQQKKS